MGPRYSREAWYDLISRDHVPVRCHDLPAPQRTACAADMTCRLDAPVSTTPRNPCAPYMHRHGISTRSASSTAGSRCTSRPRSCVAVRAPAPLCVPCTRVRPCPAPMLSAMQVRMHAVAAGQGKHIRGRKHEMRLDRMSILDAAALCRPKTEAPFVAKQYALQQARAGS